MQEAEKLIEEAKQFPPLAEKVQDDANHSEDERENALHELRGLYADWRLNAMRLIREHGSSDESHNFEGEYGGVFGGGKIAGFLSNGLEPNYFYNPEQALPGMERWERPYYKEFKQPLDNQLAMLARLNPDSASKEDATSGLGIFFGGSHNIASGTHINQSVQVGEVRTGDLDSLLKSLADAGLAEDELEALKGAIEADENDSIKGAEPSKVAEWISRMSLGLFQGGVTAASSEAMAQIIQAIGKYQGL